MVSGEQINKSKSIQQQTGKTFYFATLLLPKRVRYATHILYAFFRIADEVVDTSENKNSRTKIRQLNEIQEAVLGKSLTENPSLKAFEELRRRYNIPTTEIVAFLEAMRMDISKSRYDTFEEVEGYMRGSAVTVANMMVSIMKIEETEEITRSAAALGKAFQLTNFLRDVREDIIEYNRSYMPRETLEKYGVGYKEIEGLEFSEAFSKVMREEIIRAENFYREGVEGIKYLPKDCQFAVLLASILYADHHRLIVKQDYDVLTRRSTLNMSDKIVCLMRGWWYLRVTKDPKATFYLSTKMPDDIKEEHQNKGKSMRRVLKSMRRVFNEKELLANFQK